MTGSFIKLHRPRERIERSYRLPDHGGVRRPGVKGPLIFLKFGVFRVLANKMAAVFSTYLHMLERLLERRLLMAILMLLLLLLVLILRYRFYCCCYCCCS